MLLKDRSGEEFRNWNLYKQAKLFLAEHHDSDLASSLSLDLEVHTHYFPQGGSVSHMKGSAWNHHFLGQETMYTSPYNCNTCMRGMAEDTPCRVHTHGLKMSSTKLQEKRCPEKWAFLWWIWGSLHCFLQTLACCIRACHHGDFYRTSKCQLHAHHHPAVNEDMQRHILTVVTSLVSISSSHPAKTSRLTPTFTIIKGSADTQAGAERSRIPKAADVVTAVAVSPAPGQQTGAHSSCWTTRTSGQTAMPDFKKLLTQWWCAVIHKRVSHPRSADNGAEELI